MERDPLAQAKAHAAEIKEELLREAGGGWTIDELSRHLKVSLAAVQQRLARGGLLAVYLGGKTLFPRCQFTPSGTPVGLGELLRAIDTQDPWIKLAVLLSPTLKRDPRVSPEDDAEVSVIDAFKRGRKEEAMHAAHSWGRQGS